MKNKSWIITVVFLAYFAFSILIAEATEQQLPSGYRMHRTQAGNLKDGWTEAHSTEGCFSVSMPMLFNDFTIDISEVSSSVTHTYMVGGVTQDGAKFAACKIAYRDPRNDPKKYFDNYMNIELSGYTVESKTRSEVAGIPAIDIKCSSASIIGYQRIMLLSDSTLLLGVEIPISRMSNYEPKVQRFLDSVHVDVPTK